MQSVVKPLSATTDTATLTNCDVTRTTNTTNTTTTTDATDAAADKPCTRAKRPAGKSAHLSLTWIACLFLSID